MAKDSDGIDITLARPKAAEGQSKVEALPVEPSGKYEHPEGEVELGRGGMGRVLRLSDVHLKREVAVKELLPEASVASSTGPMFANLFVREAQVLARLEHPGVVPIYELGRRADGTPYYAMRKIRGRSLTVALEACSSLEERLSLVPHLVDVAHTVGFAHAQGVVHRDLKPDNVMVGPFGETLVVDWGLALVDGEHAEGELAGTPAYMSPEQVNGGRLDARSDVWSLGVMLYELLSGELPFGGTSVSEVLEQVKMRDVPSLRRKESKVPRPLVAVVERALSKNPDARFQNGEALATALEAALRARQTRPVTVPILLACVLVAVGLGWWRQTTTVDSLQRGQESEALKALDARRVAAHRLAESAVLALRSNDTFAAEQLAKAALLDGPEPLARGVLLLTAERGVPTLEWKVPVEAGCSRLAVTPQRVACATLNGVELFDPRTGEAKEHLSAGPAAGWLRGVAALSADVFVAGGDNRALFAWSLAKPSAPETWTFPESISAVSAGSGGVLVALRTGALFRQPRVGERVELPTFPSRVKVLASLGARFAVGGDALLRVHEADGREVTTLDRTALALEPGPGGALFAGVERSLLQLDGATVTRVFSGHRDAVTAIAAGPRLASGDGDGEVRVWFEDGALATSWRAFEPGVQALAWAADGARLIVAPRGRSLEAWSVPEPLTTLPDDGVPTFHAWWSRGWLMTGLRDGRLRKVDASSLRTDVLESRHAGAVRAIAEVPSDERPGSLRHLSGGDDGRVLALRWNGEVDVLDEVKGRSVLALDVSPDGRRAAWAFDDGTVVLWALTERTQVRRLRESVVRSIDFSLDSTRVALGREDRRVVLLDASDGAEKGRLEETDAPILVVRWLSQGLATASANGQVQVWGVAERRVQRAFAQPRDRVATLASSPDGARLAAGSDDGRVYVWELESGALLAEIPADAGQVLLVSFVDDVTLVAAGTDRQLHVWALGPR